jgi:hypothetical protein
VTPPWTREWEECAHEHGGIARVRYSDFEETALRDMCRTRTSYGRLSLRNLVAGVSIGTRGFSRNSKRKKISNRTKFFSANSGVLLARPESGTPTPSRSWCVRAFALTAWASRLDSRTAQTGCSPRVPVYCKEEPSGSATYHLVDCGSRRWGQSRDAGVSATRRGRKARLLKKRGGELCPVLCPPPNPTECYAALTSRLKSSWLNPSDNQGVRFLIDDVQAGMAERRHRKRIAGTCY